MSALKNVILIQDHGGDRATALVAYPAEVADKLVSLGVARHLATTIRQDTLPERRSVKDRTVEKGS